VVELEKVSRLYKYTSTSFASLEWVEDKVGMGSEELTEVLLA
jgi:hypothetical protein